jgi:radical SAM protein with 4Fe4S-binding SPASM domain
MTNRVPAIAPSIPNASRRSSRDTTRNDPAAVSKRLIPMPNPKRKRLTDFNCTEVSVCRTPRNKLARILIAKAAEGAKVPPVAKLDEDARYAAGWALVSEVDNQPYYDDEGDHMTERDLVASAQQFMERFRVGKRSHEGEADMITYVESVVFTKELQRTLGIDLGIVGWWLGGIIRDQDLWEAVKRGEFRGFSVAGEAVRLVVEEEEPSPYVSKAGRSGGARLFNEIEQNVSIPSAADIRKALRTAPPKAKPKTWQACADCSAPRVCAGSCAMEVRQRAVSKALDDAERKLISGSQHYERTEESIAERIAKADLPPAVARTMELLLTATAEGVAKGEGVRDPAEDAIRQLAGIAR